MKFDILTKRRVGAVLAFSLAMAGAASYTGAKDKNNVIDAKQAHSPEAGFSAVMNQRQIQNPDVTAGFSDILYDTAKVTVSDNKVEKVGEGLEEKTEDRSFCGYKKLGVALVEGNLNIRNKADTKGKILGKMTNHDACEILAEKGDWFKISSGKVKGYVKKEYLVRGDQAVTLAKEEMETVATVKTTTLHVREKASDRSAVLTMVGDGEDFLVEEEKDGWYKIEVDDQKGYISGDYVDISEKLPTAQSVKELDASEDGVTDTRVSLVQYALQFVGNPYVWGGTSLTGGIDCSGFTMQVYAHYGVSLPHHAASQPGYGTRISASEARPGDLFFYGNGSSIGHVGIYIGNGQIVHASNPRTGIKISSAYYRTPICVVRYLN